MNHEDHDWHELQQGTQTLRFWVQYSGRRKTLGLTVNAAGIRVTAPPGTSLELIRQMLAPKAPALLARMGQLEAVQAAPRLPRQYVSGESLRLLGRPLVLRRLVAEDVNVKLHGSRVYLTAPDEQAAQSALEAWYAAGARTVFTERVPLWASRLGVSPGNILIRSQRARWGSCDAYGNLRLNWRLVMAPLTLIDYVLAHELAHLRAPDHSPHFWAALRSVMPNYEARKQRLAQQGADYTL